MSDDKLIKKPYSGVQYTPEMIRELKACLDPVTGPEYFCENFVYVRHPTKGRMRFHLYDHQKDLIHNYHNYRYSISMVGRQMGKCLTGDTMIRVRNKVTGEVLDVSMEAFHARMSPNNGHGE